MAALTEWIGERFALSAKAPMAPEDFASALPEKDADHAEGDETCLDESDIQGQSFIIEYRDSAGEISNRRITVRKLHRTADGCLCLKCFCWERDAPRSFRADHILKMQRLSDSAIIPSPTAFFEKYMTDGIDGHAAALLKSVRPGLRVLLYLARCDGSVHPAETAVMRRYVSAHAVGPVTWSGIDSFLEGQHPDKVLARSMLKAALGQRHEAQHLLSAANILIDADGVLAPQEIDSVEKMFAFSEAKRYQEDIRQ